MWGWLECYKILGVGMGKNVGVGDGMGYLKNKNLRVGVAVFNPGEGDGLISNCEKN